MDGEALMRYLPLLGCPQCAGPLALGSGPTLRCASCAVDHAIVHGIPDLRLRSRADSCTETVRSFYTAAPFPGYPPRDSLSALRARAERSEFARLLDSAIAPDARVLEMGCGTGQMSLYLARNERQIIGADLTRASLTLAESAAQRFGLAATDDETQLRRVLFVETDLRAPGLREGSFDVVYSSGVLHHTADPAESFRSLVRLCRSGGVIVLGLYNAYARFPHRLRRVVARLTKNRYIPFDPVLRDRAAEPERRAAWLQDQYLHPEEHRHTLREVERWFAENGIEYLRSYPSTLIGAPPLMGDELFEPAEDNWRFENVLAQLAWMGTLGHEGGLFMTIGKKR